MNIIYLTKYINYDILILRWKGKVIIFTYTSESGVVETDYKDIVKEHLGANYRKDNS